MSISPRVPGAARERVDPLERDIAFLDGLLDETLLKLEGREAFGLVEETRRAALRLRAEPSDVTAAALLERLSGQPLSALRTLIRVFTLYFDLINLAEQEARIRVLRERAMEGSSVALGETPARAIVGLRERGVTAAEIRAALATLEIRPVFTAHPSEARRRTVIEKLHAIAHELERCEYSRLTPRERDASLRAITAEVESFWLTEIVRGRRPTALDEVSQGVGMVADSLFRVVPDAYRSLESALAEAYPEERFEVPSFLRFGSWIGGDRDGNPHVTAEVTRDAIRLYQQVVLDHYRRRVRALGQKLSQSSALAPVGATLLASVERDLAAFPEARTGETTEIYRQKCRIIERRLALTRAYVTDLVSDWYAPPPPTPAGIYREPAALIEDLEEIRDDLERHHATHAALDGVRDLVREIDVFGLHFLTLDVRQHANRHASALDEILRWAGTCPAYQRLDANERFELLARELGHRRPLIPSRLPFSEATCEVVDTFRTLGGILEQRSDDAVQRYIISGTSEAGQVLEVLLLAREARLFDPDAGRSRLDVVPLFESLDALERAAPIIERLLALPVYRRQLELRNGIQEVMLGYSDSSKETGPLQSAWAIYKTNRDLDALGERAGITVQMFHGRGGAVGRGGGPANRAILAQPPRNGRIAITEQGEMIADRYTRAPIAERHLDQILHAVLTTRFPTDKPLRDDWVWALERLAASARRHYRALVYETPGFVSYFEQATPFAEIGSLKIASRPAKRTETAGIDDLRAIPWVFSWMQNRHTLSGWYGIGSAVADFLREDGGEMTQLQEMYAHWPFWRALVDNTQMILAKADLTIGRLYAGLVSDRALGLRIFERIEAEFHATCDAVCEVARQDALLDDMPVLKRSIERRNPYVDPLSFIQIVLLDRLRNREEWSGESRDDLLTACLESINGIAAGLKNTG